MAAIDVRKDRHRLLWRSLKNPTVAIVHKYVKNKSVVRKRLEAHRANCAEVRLIG